MMMILMNINHFLKAMKRDLIIIIDDVEKIRKNSYYFFDIIKNPSIGNLIKDHISSIKIYAKDLI